MKIKDAKYIFSNGFYVLCEDGRPTGIFYKSSELFINANWFVIPQK
jgi:hypothetical protein